MRHGLRAGLLAALCGTGCMVQIDSVRDPAPAFREARSEALKHQGRRGPAREVNVLVYHASDRKLVRARAPMWLLRKLERRVDWGDAVEHELALDDKERARRAVRRHLRLEDIEKAGLGLLLEASEDDGEQVLVWLR